MFKSTEMYAFFVSVNKRFDIKLMGLIYNTVFVSSCMQHINSNLLRNVYIAVIMILKY